MKRAIAIAGVLALAVTVRALAPVGEGGATATTAATEASAALALGFVLLVSFLAGGQAPRLGLPAITGYLFVGMAFGPYLLGGLHPSLGVLGHDSVASLRLLDSVALGLIALTAGGELRMAALRLRGKPILSVLCFQVLLTSLGVGGGLALLWEHFPAMAGLSPREALAAALLLGVIATANSPATALAVIQESRASGPLSEIVLAVTVAKDVVVILLFSVAISLAVFLTGTGAGAGLASLPRLAWELGGSIALGVLLGLLVARILVRLGTDLPLLVLGVAFVAVTLLPMLHLSGLLACLVAGFVIENHSPHGDRLIKAIERHSLPVYVVFFTIAGASLDLRTLVDVLPLALFIAGVRLVMIVLSTALGAKLGSAPAGVAGYGWSGFVAQAGVTLGFAALVEQRLPGIGSQVSSATLAVVALNQVAGPILFRLGLLRSGEAGKAGQSTDGRQDSPSSTEPAFQPDAAGDAAGSASASPTRPGK